MATSNVGALVLAVPKWLNYPEIRDQGFLNAPTVRAFRALNAIEQTRTADDYLITIRVGAHNFVEVNTGGTGGAVAPTSSTFYDFTGSGATGETIATTEATSKLWNAKYSHVMYYGRLLLDEPMLKNLEHQPDRLTRYVRGMMETMMKGWSRWLNRRIWGADNNGVILPRTSTYQPNFNPLAHLIDAPTWDTGNTKYWDGGTNALTSQTLGNIQRSNSVNKWWNSIVVEGGDTPVALTWSLFTLPMVQIEASGEPSPNLIVVNPRVAGWLQSQGIAAQQFVNISTRAQGNFGFSAFRVMNAMVVVEELLDNLGTAGGSVGTSTAPAQIFYFNTDDIYVIASEAASADEVPVMNPLRAWKVTQTAQLVAANLRSAGRLVKVYV